MELNRLINDFRDYLLSSDLKSHIAKVILFGSHAKGVASPDSDIDVIVFTTDGIGVEEALMDRIYDFMIDTNAPLEVLISGIDSLFICQDYFTYNITQYGWEIYSMEKDEIKMTMLKDLIDLAEEYLDSAQEVLESDRIRVAVDAAYNAAELAAKALILSKQDDLPGSHGGVVSVFGQLYVKTNELDKALGRELNTALKLRNTARYKANVLLTKEDAKGVLDLAEKLITVMSEKQLARKTKSSERGS